MLALVGSGEYLPPMEPVDRYLLAQLKDEPRVVCLPTAAGGEGEERVAYWSELGAAHFTRLGARAEALPVIDRDTADDPALAERIAASNFVYLSGGRPDYLLETLRGTRAWEAILSVHQSHGVVAGCSAGAMVLGGRIPGKLRWLEAFGLLPGTVIVPHYDEIPAWMTHLVRGLAPRREALLGIEGDTALAASNGSCRVVGSGRVEAWDRRGRRSYSDGEWIEWKSSPK